MHSQSDLQDYGCVRTACWDARIVGSENSPTSSTANLSLTDRTSFDREGVALKACRPLMPRFIGRYHLPRSSIPLTWARPQQIDRQRRATRSGCSSSLTIRHCAISFVIIYGTTSARRTVLAGSSRLQMSPPGWRQLQTLGLLIS
jgi:hypothetical protein